MNFLETNNKKQQAVNKRYTTIPLWWDKSNTFSSHPYTPQAVLGHSESQGEFVKFDQTLLEGRAVSISTQVLWIWHAGAKRHSHEES